MSESPPPPQQLALLDLPTTKLLDKFGAGKPVPGSGSAAALMGILSAKLVLTVCRLTLEKPRYESTFKEARHIISSIESEIEPKLRELFFRDAEIFDQVIKARIARKDATTESEKKKIGRKLQSLMKEASEIPMSIGDQCIILIGYSIFNFDSGFKSARGDSGAALSAAIAAVSSAIFVVNLNLKSISQGQWKDEFSTRVKALTDLLDKKQMEAFARLTNMSEDEVVQMEMDIANVGQDAAPQNEAPQTPGF